MLRQGDASFAEIEKRDWAAHDVDARRVLEKLVATRAVRLPEDVL
jgi:hypothetical protein